METVLYEVAGPVATITLNRPEALNTIVPPMPDEVEQCVGQAVRDPTVRVIVVRGAGRAGVSRRTIVPWPTRPTCARRRAACAASSG